MKTPLAELRKRVTKTHLPVYKYGGKYYRLKTDGSSILVEPRRDRTGFYPTGSKDVRHHDNTKVVEIFDPV